MLWLYARQPGRVLKKLNAIRKRDCSDIPENDFLTAGHLVFFKTPPGCWAHSHREKNCVNSSLSFRQAALIFCLPVATSCLPKLMILLEDDLPGKWLIGQVSFQSCKPHKKI